LKIAKFHKPDTQEVKPDVSCQQLWRAFHERKEKLDTEKTNSDTRVGPLATLSEDTSGLHDTAMRKQ